MTSSPDDTAPGGKTRGGANSEISTGDYQNLPDARGKSSISLPTAAEQKWWNQVKRAEILLLKSFEHARPKMIFQAIPRRPPGLTMAHCVCALLRLKDRGEILEADPHSAVPRMWVLAPGVQR
jgi:hypothetical protein